MSSDLAHQAALQALKAAGMAASDLDLIIVATSTPDFIFPSTACVLQAKLGAVRCPAFDVQAVCSGFVYALDIADKFIRSGAYKRALVVGTEVFCIVRGRYPFVPSQICNEISTPEYFITNDL